MHSGLAIEDIAHPLAGCTTNGRRGLNCRMCGSLNVRLIRFTSSSVEGHRVSSHKSFFPVTLTAGGGDILDNTSVEEQINTLKLKANFFLRFKLDKIGRVWILDLVLGLRVHP